MKKTLLLLTLLIVGFGVWLLLKREPQPPAPLSTTTIPEAKQLSFKEVETNSMIAMPDTNCVASYPPISTPINALTATNLDQWKSMISGLKHSDNFGRWSSWIMEQTNHLTGIPVVFEENGKMVSYKVQFIDVRVFSDGERVRRVEMHSPSMDIDETRKLGLQLGGMFGVDSKDFLAWCDKVGNHWMDQQLYATGERSYGFQILNTFNNEKPWSINFIIQNP